MNSVDGLSMIFLTELRTDGMYYVGKNGTSSFFCFVLIFFFYCNSLCKYQGNIFVGKIRRQFTNKNIPLIFLFVFFDFLIVNFIDKYVISPTNKTVCNFINDFFHITKGLNPTNILLVAFHVIIFNSMEFYDGLSPSIIQIIF